MASFEELYTAHFAALAIQLYSITGDMSEAQDVVQEAFSRAWPRWDRLARYDDPVAWVRRVAWNIATSRWRRARTAARHLAGQRPQYADAPGPDRVALLEAMKQLPFRQRRAVALHYLAGLSIGDIAMDCGVPESTVRSWLHRGRASLHRQLSERRVG